MAKYDPLYNFLKSKDIGNLPMSFSEIERVLGFKLPASAYQHPAWWANEHSTHVQARSWLNAGYETESVDRTRCKLVFKRVSSVGPLSSGGMQDAAPDWRGPREKVARHPAIGALKGMFTIEPGYDIANSDPEEVAEWEAAIDRKADLYDAGRTKK